MAEAAPTPRPPQGNPALRMMGIPNIRMKLPSRNWTIFLTTVSAFAGAVTYDRYTAKQNQRKWCNAVAHFASQPLSPQDLPRKVTVYIAAPPGDGLSPARQHWEKYIKPVLVAAALDYDLVEGRKMGEIRVAVAEDVRKERVRAGEVADAPEGMETDAVEALRAQAGIQREGEGGVVVVGRHTWKEWVMGVHEGWLGPLKAPVVEEVVEKPGITEDAATSTQQQSEQPEAGFVADGDDASPTTQPTPPEEPKPAEEEKPKKPTVPAPCILPEAYASAALPQSIPEHLPPAAVLPFPHILGFLNTPIRLYRFLNRRHLSDELGREAAAICFGAYAPFPSAPQPEAVMSSNEDVERGLHAQKEVGSEVSGALQHEESEWPKRVWTDEKYKGVWTEEVKVDDRLGERLRKFVLPAGVEERVNAEAAAGGKKKGEKEEEI